MNNHVAGALHSDAGPVWLPYPEDVNELMTELWPAGIGRGDGGVLTVAGLSVADLVAEYGTALYVMDESDFRSRARRFVRAFNDAFAAEFGRPVGADNAGAVDVYYAGKAFLCSQVAGWVIDEGLRLDTCTGGELAVAARAGVPGAKIGLHGNNKSDAELRRAVQMGVGRIVIDSLDEIERVARTAREFGVSVPVMVRVTVGVEAHTHEYIATAHEDQKFGLSITGGMAADAVRRITALPELTLLGLHSHIGSQIFDMSGFEVAATRLLELRADMDAELGDGACGDEVDLGGGFGIAYTSQDDPQPPELMAETIAGVLRRTCTGLGVRPPHVSIEPGRAIAGPAMFTLYTVGTIKDVDTGQGIRRYVSVDGGMSDNARTALYNADYSCTLASRTSTAHPVVARVVGKHCESGDVVVRDEYLPADLVPGDMIAVPSTGAYCRPLASNYNHVPRPPVVAVRDGVARVLVRGETIDDLLAFDVPATAGEHTPADEQTRADEPTGRGRL
ncbi:diaminopimelate decarboxylase [Spelaeicoccus albus]|uniref:Diaminopimelate decarboxylase n=1 Tax=Spelaeicoccus albus TaxID=1280376 RepID=A0A7Z0II34_9MICO|nr:diaminopimelate decarboxylase [Spelaeicoccus albus]NYI68135.1 diaminopimelate decarboxylase [Spelaeicoccus albus]